MSTLYWKLTPALAGGWPTWPAGAWTFWSRTAWAMSLAVSPRAASRSGRIQSRMAYSRSPTMVMSPTPFTRDRGS